jgi:hypothetical protein
MSNASDRKGALAELVRGLMAELPPVLHRWFSDNFRAPAAWFEARLAFTRSCAVMSMIGYSVGLGDRHLENILIDTTTGSLMHVDFACLFDHGLNLETPEKVPFRLTPNLIHTFGVCGADGVFRRVCELTLHQLRLNKLTMLTILSTYRRTASNPGLSHRCQTACDRLPVVTDCATTRSSSGRGAMPPRTRRACARVTRPRGSSRRSTSSSKASTRCAPPRRSPSTDKSRG